MPLVSVVLLGLAVSVDGFGVGFAYGLRRVYIPPISIMIVCLSSAVSIFASMLAGSWVATLFSEQLASIIGGIMLIGVGLLIIRQSLLSKWGCRSAAKPQEEKGFTLFADVLLDASRADLDHSGVITGQEALVLGVALAIDAFGTGFGAALMGFKPFSVAVAVGLTNLLLLSIGLLLGKHYSQKVEGKKAAVFAGIVLLVLGITRVFG